MNANLNNTTRRRLTVVIAVAICSFLALSTQAQAEAPEPTKETNSAWETLLSVTPEIGNDPSISAFEKKILQILSPAQIADYTAGGDPATIILPNGESLADFLIRSERTKAAGLVFQPLEPCTIVDTRETGAKFMADESRTFRVHGKHTAYKELGGSPIGCGIPGMMGSLLRSNSARALLVNLEVLDAEGSGSLRIWAAGKPATPEAAALHYADMPELIGFKNSAIVSMCDEVSTNPCPNGDLQLQVLESGAHVTLSVLGYFESATNGLTDLDIPLKDHELNSWTNNGTDIFYDDGYVGIGTDNPKTALHVLGNITVPGSFFIGGGAARASGSNSTAIGHSARAVAPGSLAVGAKASASDPKSIAIGRRATAEANNGIAIGSSARSSHRNSVAIGKGAATTTRNQVVFGSSADALDAVFFGALSPMGGIKFPDGTTQNSAGGSPSDCGFHLITHAIGEPGRDTICPAGKVMAGVKANEDHDNNAILTHIYCCKL